MADLPQGWTPVADTSSLPEGWKIAGNDAVNKPEVPSLSAYQEPGIIDRAKTMARNAISPIIGESANQKMQRDYALSSLSQINPQLAQAANDSVPDAAKKFQIHGMMPAVDMATRAGGAAGGQALGAGTGEFAPVAIPVLGGIGAGIGDAIAQKRRMAYGEQDGFNIGELAQSAILGAIPGGSLAKSGQSAVLGEAAKQGLGGLAGETARSLIDEGKLPDVKDAAWATILPALGGAVAHHVQQLSPEIVAARTAAENQVAAKARVLAKGQSEGMVIPPSLVNPSTANNIIETIAGKKALVNQSIHANQEVANNIAQRVLDPTNPDLPLTSAVTQAVRNRAYQAGYVPLENIGQIPTDAQYAGDLSRIVNNQAAAARSFPGAVSNDLDNVVKPLLVPSFDSGDAMKMVQILRNNASEAFRRGDSSIGIAQKQAASAIENQMERNLAASGTPQATDLLNNFRDARKLMAQSHEIEDAIREGGDSIVSSKLGTRFQAGAPLSGGLETIGGMANNFPSVMKESARTPPMGTTIASRVGQTAALAATAGGLTQSPEAAALGAVAGVLMPGMRSLMRNMILSGPYQRIMARIPVHVMASPDAGALIIRQGAQAIGAHQEDARKALEDGVTEQPRPSAQPAAEPTPSPDTPLVSNP